MSWRFRDRFPDRGREYILRRNMLYTFFNWAENEDFKDDEQNPSEGFDDELDNAFIHPSPVDFIVLFMDF